MKKLSPNSYIRVLSPSDSIARLGGFEANLSAKETLENLVSWMKLILLVFNTIAHACWSLSREENFKTSEKNRSQHINQDGAHKEGKIGIAVIGCT